MTKKQLHDLALRMYRNEVYLMWVDEPDFLKVFPVVLLGADKWRKDYIETIGGAYSTCDRAGGMVPGRGINGKPIFFSCTLINRKDCQPLMDEYEQIKELNEGD